MRRPVAMGPPPSPVEISAYDDLILRGRTPFTPRRFPVYTALVGGVLLLAGTVFLCVGLSIIFSPLLSHGKDRGFIFLILGGIMFLPGSYSSFIIYASYKRWAGYDYSLLPSYDEDS